MRVDENQDYEEKQLRRDPHAEGSDLEDLQDNRFEDVRTNDLLDSKLGFDRYEDGPERLGWLVNMQSVTHLCSCVTCARRMLDSHERRRVAWWPCSD